MADQTIAPEQTAAAVLPIYDAFSDRDLPGAFACMTDDIQWHESEGLPWGGLKIGPAAVAEGVFAPSLARIPDLRITPEEVATAGDTVTVVHRYASATAGLDLLGVGVWTVRDGRISRYRQFVDTVMFRAAIGA
jgi:uncharacterized protein